MSELNVIKAYFPTFDADYNEMLLVSHTKENYMPAKQIECYLKSEADKVIAEKDAEIARLKAIRKVHVEAITSMGAGIHQDEEEILHQKYKRCLAMAEWCNSEMGRETFACFRPRHTKELWKEEHRYWAKWRKIWFELYKKFKEAK